jgi:heme O synthase-like polyprenyltransferase
LFDYWELTKPEINFLIAITAAVGFWMGLSVAASHFPWMLFLHTLLGTALVSGGQPDKRRLNSC